MLSPITIRYAVRSVRRSLATAAVADLFGLADAEPPYIVADGVALDIRSGDVVLFVGPSGSGKSSLLRAAGEQLNAVDAAALELPDLPLADALPGPLPERLDRLAACGLSEARLLLRTPSQLSDGQRYRFRLAYALSPLSRLCGRGAGGEGGYFESEKTLTPSPSPAKPGEGNRNTPFVLADEFCAVLDRTLAKVVAFNVRKLASRTGVGFLLATTHDDLIDDLNPDLVVRCHGDGAIDVERRVVKKKAISFHDELWFSDGAVGDWPHFARWHYRSHHLAFVRRVMLLWHGTEPVGVCVFSAPAASLTLRSRYFGLHRARSREHLAALNRQLWLLSRVVLHPTYRGAGIAAAFVRRACQTCLAPWIETLSAMGQVNPFFERAGFVRVGLVRKDWRAGLRERPESGNGAYAGGRRLSAESAAKSRFSEPVYYVFDNRGGRKTKKPNPRPSSPRGKGERIQEDPLILTPFPLREGGRGLGS